MIIVTTNAFAQIADLIIEQSIDACIYIDESNEKLFIIDQVYSDDMIYENKIVFNEKNLTKYDDKFSYDFSKKFKYYLISEIIKDSVDMYSITNKVSINKINDIKQHWRKINFKKINLENNLYYDCSKGFNDISRFEYNYKFPMINNKTLFFTKKSDKVEVSLIDENYCAMIFNETYSNIDTKINSYKKDLCFVHADNSLLIIKIPR